MGGDYENGIGSRNFSETSPFSQYDTYSFDLDGAVNSQFDFDQRNNLNAYADAVDMATKLAVPIVTVFGSSKLSETQAVLEELIPELRRLDDPDKKPVYAYIDIDLVDDREQSELKKYIDEVVRPSNSACTVVFAIEAGKYRGHVPEMPTVVRGGNQGLAIALKESLRLSQAKIDKRKNMFSIRPKRLPPIH